MKWIKSGECFSFTKVKDGNDHKIPLQHACYISQMKYYANHVSKEASSFQSVMKYLNIFEFFL